LRRRQRGEEVGQGVVILVLPDQVEHVPVGERPGLERGREGGRGGGWGGAGGGGGTHLLAPVDAGAEGRWLTAGAAAALHLLLHVLRPGFQQLGDKWGREGKREDDGEGKGRMKGDGGGAPKGSKQGRKGGEEEGRDGDNVPARLLGRA